MTKSNVITIGNYKGGVGKSTVTELFAYLLTEKHNKKVLVIDTDPQQNSTEKIRKDFNFYEEPKRTFMESIKAFDLKPSILEVTNNLHIIAGDWELETFDDFVFTQETRAKYYLLNTLLDEVKHYYDIVLIDTRPSTGKMNNNTVCASDYVLIVAKTEQDSFTSSSKYYEFLSYMSKYNPNLRFLGVLQYLVNIYGSTDKKVIRDFNELFEDDIFKNSIRSSERVKTWGYAGITTTQPHDKKTLEMYDKVVIELLERMGEV